MPASGLLLYAGKDISLKLALKKNTPILKKTPAWVAGVVIFFFLTDAEAAVDAVVMAGVAAMEDDASLRYDAFWHTVCDNDCSWRNNASTSWDALRISFSLHAPCNEADEVAWAVTVVKRRRY